MGKQTFFGFLLLLMVGFGLILYDVSPTEPTSTDAALVTVAPDADNSAAFATARTLNPYWQAFVGLTAVLLPLVMIGCSVLFWSSADAQMYQRKPKRKRKEIAL